MIILRFARFLLSHHNVQNILLIYNFYKQKTVPVSQNEQVDQEAKALAEKVSKLMVLRTHPKNYYKASSKGDQLLAKYVFQQKRGFAKSLLSRTQRYNDSVQFARSASGQKILEVCPPDLKNMAGRLSQNKAKIRYSYDVGIETGLKAIEDWKNL